MKIKFNLKNNLYFTLSLCILLAAVLSIILLLSSCNTEAESYDNADKIAGASQPEISVISFELKDLNGADTYPGDQMAVVVRIKNTGQAEAENISLELNLPEILIPHGNGAEDQPEKSSLPGSEKPGVTISGSNAEIEQLAPGEDITVEIPLEVAGNIKKDINDKLSLKVSNKNNGEDLIEDISFTVFGVAPYERDEIPIIGLHSIVEKIEIPIELSTYHFDVLCKTLKSFGFETITFTDLLNHVQFGRVLPEKSVIITSDDGFANIYDNAFEVLKKYDYKMTVNLVTNFVKETESERVTNYFDSNRPVPMRPILIWPEVKEMDQYGCEFLSHSANHIRLGLATDEEFKQELSKSKKDIEDHLGKPVLFFAWPYDNNDPEKLKFLPELGYVGAVRYWGGIENISTIDLKVIKRVEFNSLIAPESYTTYLNLHSVSVESQVQTSPVKAGSEFILEYKIKNNDDMDLPVTSIELELPQAISLEGLDNNSYITQYPGFKDGIFMWVGDGYSVKAADEINLRLRLISSQAGTNTIKFRISAYNGYIEADDVQINIK